MSVTELEKAIVALPFQKLDQLFSHIEEKIEDWLDARAAREAMREGKYKPLERVLKELHEHRCQSKSRKISSVHYRRPSRRAN